MIERDHGNWYIAPLRAYAGGAEGCNQGFLRRGGQAPESSENAGDCILTDGGIVEGGVERIRREDGWTADA